MKRILYSTTAVVVFAAIMVSCKDNTRIASEVLPVSSTSELAKFRQWQAEKLAKENSAKTVSYASTSTARKRTTYRAPVATVPASQPAKKKGWSKAAKGAVIGGVAGGAAGAILIKKNRALGGAIGAVAGAAGGYVIGRGMDKKDGRVRK